MRKGRDMKANATSAVGGLIEDRAESLFRYMGGKRRMRRLLVDLMKKSFNAYFEPFIGAANLYLELWNRGFRGPAFLGDFNPEVANVHLAVKTNPSGFLKEYSAHALNDSKAYFCQVRDADLSGWSSAARAARTVFGTLTGLRPQELRLVRRPNIIKDDQGRQYVHIEQHKTSASARVHLPRTVPLSAEAAEILVRQLAKHPTSEFVFLNEDGKPYTAVGLRQRLQRWCRRAGVPVMPPYALRHVFGTRQGNNGTNQAIISQLMGHSNLQTAARYMVNCDPAHLGAVDRMAERIMPVIRKASPDLSKAS